jgi:ATP-dependent RNA helicase SUPV3L1/SUV3
MDRSLGGAGIRFRAAGTHAGRGVAVVEQGSAMHGRPLLGRPLGLCFRGGLKTGENTELADASMSACDRYFLPQPTRVPSVTHANSKPHDLQQLDALTGGAFTAATSGDRAARIREWLATAPAQDLMQEVFKELSVKDKGAARPLREKLDELRRAKTQDALAADWATRGQVLLDTPRLNIADAMAWQRDAAKAGAPLSREPLASLKAALSERIKVVEDLQNQAMVQREAAVLLAQRIELLSTKGWKDAHAVADALRTDVTHWQAQADALEGDANWSCVDTKYTPMIESSRAQLLVVWDAFSAALGQAVAADADPAAPLPPVPVWADQLRAARGLPAEAAARPAKPKVDPAVREEQRQKAAAAVTPVLERVEQEVSEGHGKASAGAAAALRNAFKEHGRHLDSALEARVHAALGAAGELEGWQRWRAISCAKSSWPRRKRCCNASPRSK